MEKFRIDFSMTNPFPDGKKLGECGEKNAVMLVITPPLDFLIRVEIKSLVVAFSTEKGPVRYGPFPKISPINVPVGSALTVGSALSVQLEGYDSDGEFIVKTPVVSGIMLSASIADGNCSCDDDGKSVIPGHFHENLDVLHNLSESDGTLFYNERPIVSWGETQESIVTVELLASDGTFTVMPAEPFYGSMAFVSLPDGNGIQHIPVGAEIVSVEVNLESADNPVWTDIRDMIETSPHIPYFINQNKAYYSHSVSGVVVANVTFVNENVNSFYEAAEGYSYSGMRVKYIDKGGQE